MNPSHWSVPVIHTDPVMTDTVVSYRSLLLLGSVTGELHAAHPVLTVLRQTTRAKIFPTQV